MFARYSDSILNRRFLIKLILFLGGTILLGRLSLIMPFSWIVNLFLFSVVSLFLAVFSRIISIRYIYQLIRFGGEGPGTV